jgi:hypothetical protein
LEPSIVTADLPHQLFSDTKDEERDEEPGADETITVAKITKITSVLQYSVRPRTFSKNLKKSKVINSKNPLPFKIYS